MNICIYCRYVNDDSEEICKNCGNSLDIINEKNYNKGKVKGKLYANSNKKRGIRVSLVLGLL